MIKANPTVFKLYLEMMDSFSEYLSQKYSESSLDNPDYYKTIIIQKIVRMFHTLDTLVKEYNDEVSARCVLRGILDSVTTYCFIYQREDKDEILFRHYLYLLDGLGAYLKTIVDGILEEGDNKLDFKKYCKSIISEINNKLFSHPYLKSNNSNVVTIIKNTNWKYESLDKPKGLSFCKMYKLLGFDNKTANYYYNIMPQYTHGLCLSNFTNIDSNQLQNVLYESIPLANRMIQGICKTFPYEKMRDVFLQSDSFKKIIMCQGFNHDDLLDYANAIIRKDKMLLV